MHKEYRQRLATEYRYAVSKMQEAQPARKLFYFSVIFGEAQRVLNLEWNRDLALIYTISQNAYAQINNAIQTPGLGQVLPIDWTMVYEKLTQVADDLAVYYEKAESDDTKREICQILGRLVEISYAISGNGSYLYEKGLIKF
jgi:hypothetical protein